MKSNVDAKQLKQAWRVWCKFQACGGDTSKKLTALYENEQA